MNVDGIWNNFLNNIKDELSSLSFETWFKDTQLYKLEDGKAIIIVPMLIHKKQLSDNYSELIINNLNRITNTNFELEFLLKEEIEEETEKQNNYQQEISEGVPKNETFQSNLNPKYTFENFCVGNSNKFAQAAALSVAESPGSMYNPLFLYGNSGLGKTHLMQAIGNYIINNSNRKVLYVTSDQFISDFIGINKRGADGTNLNYVDFFKNKYRNVDVLIIDDIQFLGGATQTQQEFFHTFNTLYNDSKQIIISSDRSPDDLKLLEDRLRTRFCWGLTVNIFPPDFNLRKDILKKKIISGNFEKEIPEDVIEYIASNVGSDVRGLEGAITRLVAYSTIMGGAVIDVDLAIEALKDFISKGISEKDDIHRIQKIVAEHFGITVEDIRSKKRSANIAFPRQIAMYLCRQLTDESFPKIGIEFGGKDHSTVIHSVVKGEIKIEKVGNNVQVAEEGLILFQEPLEGIKFCVFTKDGKEVKCGTTDSEGHLTFKDLELGEYYVQEIETLENYVLDQTKHEITLKYKDQYTPVITYETILENHVPTGKLEFTKTDFSESKTLPNTTIEIYSENDILIYSGKTDENGKIVIDKLPVGKFYILEKEAPEGYKLNPEAMDFEIKEDGEVIKCTMKDELIIEVPNTNKTEYHKYIIIGLTIIIGLGLFIYGNKKY